MPKIPALFGFLRDWSSHQDARLSQHDELVQYKDAVQIIIYNLALNAVLYSSEGTVTISCRQEQEQVALSIADEGPGMPEEKVRELMSMNELDKDKVATELDNRGHGFGYFIIRDLLQIAGGRMDIDSAPGRGNIVTIWLCNV